jgi:protein involved in polysaccharide export with SLBB domain
MPVTQSKSALNKNIESHFQALLIIAMTLFSRLVLMGCLLVSVVWLSGCASTEDNQVFFPTVENTGTNDLVARLQVGDTLTVTLQGPVDEPPPHIEPINDDGTINLPEIGHVPAAGKTPGELQNEIHDLYVPKYYNQLTVSVTSGDRVYYVNGEVKAPGRQLYLGETTVTKAITSSGDFTDFANHHNVWLIRGNHRLKVDCSYVFEHPDQDPLVYPGDQIVVRRRLY